MSVLLTLRLQERQIALAKAQMAGSPVPALDKQRFEVSTGLDRWSMIRVIEA